MFDVFLSTFDTLCYDRGLLQPKSIGGRIAYYLDLLACKSASFLLLDTQAHIRYFVDAFGIPPEKFAALPVGCNEEIFYPRCDLKSNSNGFTVLYYSSYLPLHGVDIVVQAAKRLEKYSGIKFRLVGNGLTYNNVKAFVYKTGINNIEFIPPMSIEKLAMEIALADVCLGGHFGSGEKAQRVIPGKIYQILASKKPLIAAETIANKELLTDGENALLCKRSDAKDLAEKILFSYREKRFMEQLAENGRDLYVERCSERVITELIRNLIEREILV